MTTTETKITPDQLRTLQQVFPEGASVFVPQGNYGSGYKSGDYIEYKDGRSINVVAVNGNSDLVRRVEKVAIPPLYPLKLQVDKWLATLPVRQYPHGVEERVAPNGITYKDETFMFIIQSWEKFKEVGE